MALPSTVLQRGTRAAQPAATLVLAGTVYCVTDEGNILEQSTGAAWVSYSSGAGAGDVVGPASATDNAVARFDGTTGKLIQNSAVTIADTTGLIAGARFANTGLNVEDTDATHLLNLKPGSNLTANRTLTLTTGDADREIEFPRQEVLRFTFDGGGAAIAADSKVRTRIPKGGTITKITLLADTSGNLVLDLWKDTYANYPPTVADTICAAAKPTLSAAQKTEDSTLTGWTTSISDGDTLVCNVDSGTTPTVNWAQLIVEYNLTK